MITFGITGGICCGKSTITKVFRDNGISIIDADIVARQVVEPGSIGLEHLVKAFGSDYLTPDGCLDRQRLGALIFSSIEQRNLLNEIMSPLINEEIAVQLQALEKQDCKLAGVDAALLCEAGNAKKYGRLIVVECRQEAQIERLIKRNGLTRAEAMNRINAQMPSAEKVKFADWVLNTDGTLEQSAEQAIKMATILRGLG